MEDYVVIPTVKDDGVVLPRYETNGASGMDVRAFIDEDIVILPGERALINTGIKMAIPQGYEIQVRPRSGLAIKHGITVLNAPGTIDSDYRNYIGVILFNTSNNPFVVKSGDRIAQLVLAPVARASIKETDVLDVTDRNTGGFGHTGVK